MNSVSVQPTHIESVSVQGQDGVHQEFKWTSWNTPNFPLGAVTATNSRQWLCANARNQAHR